MCVADECQHSDVGLDDSSQSLHLTRFGDACLEHAHLTLLVKQPYGERHTNLRVVAARRTCHLQFWREELIEPLLYDGLSV